MMTKAALVPHSSYKMLFWLSVLIRLNALTPPMGQGLRRKKLCFCARLYCLLHQPTVHLYRAKPQTNGKAERLISTLMQMRHEQEHLKTDMTENQNLKNILISIGSR